MSSLSQDQGAPGVLSSEGNPLDAVDLHDGHLVLIEADDKSGLRLVFKTASGRTVQLYLGGVLKARADGFSEGNIVANVTVSKFRDTDVATLEHLYFVDSGFADRRPLERVRSRAISDQLRLLTVTPSYGCSVVALFKTLTISYLPLGTGAEFAPSDGG